MKKKPKIMKVPGKKACVNPYLIHLLYLSWTFITQVNLLFNRSSY